MCTSSFVLLASLLLTWISSFTFAKTYYATYFTSAAKDTFSSFSEKTLNTLMKTDDSPFAAVDLPWPIVIFDKIISTVYVSPNGAVHLEKTQPCLKSGDYFYETATCKIENSYENFIPIYLNDLYPPGSSLSQIVYFTQNNVFTIIYRRIQYYPGSVDFFNTFHINIYQDSHIDLAFDVISPGSRVALVGLRPPFNSTVLAYDKLSLATSLATWNTQQPGIYPLHKTNITSGKKFVMCPIATNWCVDPNEILYNTTLPSSTQSTVLRLTTQWLSCLISLTFQVAYSWNDTIPMQQSNATAMMVQDTTLLLHCTTIGDHYNLSYTLLCPTNSLFHNQYFWNQLLPHHHNNNVTLYLFVVWKTKDTIIDAHMTHYQYLPMIPLAIQMIANTTTTNTTNSCMSNELLPNTIIATSTSCALCQQNYTTTTLHPQCPSSSMPHYTNITSKSSYNAYLMSIYEPVLFNLTTCTPSSTRPVNNSHNNLQCIPWNTPYTTWQHHLYVQDVDGTCCSPSTLDCAGICDGHNTLAKATHDNKSFYCCPAHYPIDCNGVCNGTAIRDVCGICQGNDHTGITCFNTSLVQLHNLHQGDKEFYTNDSQAIYPLFDLQQATIMNISSVQNHQTLQIINHHTTSIVLVSMSLSSSSSSDANNGKEENYADQKYAPEVILPLYHLLQDEHIVITNGSSLTIPLTISMSDYITSFLLSPSTTITSNKQYVGWHTKTVVIQYYRIPYPLAIFNLSMTIYPKVQHCSSLMAYLQRQQSTSNSQLAARCMQLPGCIYCLTFPTTYLMKSYHQHNAHTYQTIPITTTTNSVSNKRRQLFSTMIPYHDNNHHVSLINQGSCQDGWSTLDCQ